MEVNAGQHWPRLVNSMDPSPSRSSSGGVVWTAPTPAWLAPHPWAGATELADQWTAGWCCHHLQSIGMRGTMQLAGLSDGGAQVKGRVSGWQSGTS